MVSACLPACTAHLQLRLLHGGHGERMSACMIMHLQLRLLYEGSASSTTSASWRQRIFNCVCFMRAVHLQLPLLYEGSASSTTSASWRSASSTASAL
eukprot:g29994.t1